VGSWAHAGAAASDRQTAQPTVTRLNGVIDTILTY
jgi:hypothetical protein